MRPYDDERLAELLRMLPRAPEAWVRAAYEIPQTQRELELEDIVGRARADSEFRKALIADLESALEQAGYEPDPKLVEELRQELTDS